MDAERDAGEGPESAVVSVTRAELDLAVTLAVDGVAGQIQPQRVDVLLNELERALASDQLDALVPGAPRCHPRRFDVTAGAVRELDQEGRRIVVLDRMLGRFEIGAAPVPEDAGGLGTGLDEGPAQTRDGADRSDEDVSERDDVRTQVAQRAGAGKLALETPGERHVGIGARVENEPARECPDVAENALSQQSTRFGDGRVTEVVEPDEGLHASLLCGLVHLLGVGRTEGQRLLAVDVLSGRDRSHRDLLVQEVRRDDVDDVNLRGGHRLTPVNRPAVIAQATRHRSAPDPPWRRPGSRSADGTASCRTHFRRCGSPWCETSPSARCRSWRRRARVRMS